jgi:hypothetical protein
MKPLQEELDIRFTEVIEELKKFFGDSLEFRGGVAGFLIKTGIYLAAIGGCPNEILRKQINEIVKEAYLSGFIRKL